jgi:hypothetical protein
MGIAGADTLPSMGTTHSFARVPARRLLESVFPAFVSAVKEERLEPLAPHLVEKFFVDEYGELPRLVKQHRTRPIEHDVSLAHAGSASFGLDRLLSDIVSSLVLEPILFADKAIVHFNEHVQEQPPTPETELWLAVTTTPHNVPDELLLLGDSLPSVAAPSESRELERILSDVVGEASDPSYIREIFLLLTRCRPDDGLAVFTSF